MEPRPTVLPHTPPDPSACRKVDRVHEQTPPNYKSNQTSGHSIRMPPAHKENPGQSERPSKQKAQDKDPPLFPLLNAFINSPPQTGKKESPQANARQDYK